MRYITTVARINRALIEFQFDWNKIDQTSPYPPPTGTSPPSIKRGKKDIDPVTQRIELARVFCSKIFEFMDQETSVWADELKERVAQMARQLPSQRP
jgi:hypothetical protein